MFITKELDLNDQMAIRVITKDYYLVTDVFLIVKKLIGDEEREFKFRIHEPYGRFINHIMDCKKFGMEVRK